MVIGSEMVRVNPEISTPAVSPSPRPVEVAESPTAAQTLLELNPVRQASSELAQNWQEMVGPSPSPSPSPTVVESAPLAWQSGPIALSLPTPSAGGRWGASAALASMGEGRMRTLSASTGEGVASASQSGEPQPIRANEVRSVEDYVLFVGQLEQKYPDVPGLEINRAIRQHFYGEDGVRNAGPFELFLGSEGGLKNPALAGIRDVIQGLPHEIQGPDGKSINLAHMTVGIDAHYQYQMEGRIMDPVDVAAGLFVTHAGDAGQVLGGLVRAALLSPDLESFRKDVDDAFGYASMDQLRGNQHGLEMGFKMSPESSLSQVLANYYQVPAEPPQVVVVTGRRWTPEDEADFAVFPTLWGEDEEDLQLRQGASTDTNPSTGDGSNSGNGVSLSFHPGDFSFDGGLGFEGGFGLDGGGDFGFDGGGDFGFGGGGDSQFPSFS